MMLLDLDEGVTIERKCLLLVSERGLQAAVLAQHLYFYSPSLREQRSFMVYIKF